MVAWHAGIIVVVGGFGAEPIQILLTQGAQFAGEIHGVFGAGFRGHIGGFSSVGDSGTVKK